LPKISLIIRCFNEETHIGRLLTGVSRQTRPPDEIIVVDSGSTDATLSIASAFGARVVAIPPERFSFGYALNVGLENTDADLSVFASAHVYPLYNTWIERLTAPFENDEVALTYGRQEVPPGAPFSEGRLFSHWFPPRSVERQRHPFCNNANAAIRKSQWEQDRFDEQLTGLEDLAWAKLAMEKGYAISYVAEAPIIHVHHQSFAEIMNRYRREAIAHKAIDREQQMGIATAVRLAAMNVAEDFRHARRQSRLTEVATDIVRFRAAQFAGTYQGFAQDGPVTDTLKRRFYYPSDPDPTAHLEASRIGDPIDYDEPTTAR
jgi:rhamnosyltransferase